MFKNLFTFPACPPVLTLKQRGIRKQVWLFLFISAKQVTRDYDEEEQGYDSEKEKKEEKKMADSSSPKVKESAAEKGSGDSGRESKVNGDDHHEEDMDMSDWGAFAAARLQTCVSVIPVWFFYAVLVNPKSSCTQLWALHGL